jgi:NAD-dependent DNA ligase
MSLADQSAETVVKEVIWAPSAQGYMIPRIHFEPVVIGSASIEYCTGHNARTILQHKLGPGAKIVIRRSGDVIPKLDKVVAATEASFPPEGTWAWDGDAHIKLVGGGAEFVTAKLHYFLKTLEIPGAGPSAAASLVEAGIQTPAALWAATPETLSKILGPKTGANLYANLRSILPKASEAVLMHASSTMPRGVGTTKLTSLFSVEADPRKWAGLSAPDGWTAESFQNFLGEFPKYEAWRKEIDWIPYPVMAVAAAIATASATATAQATTVARSLVVCVTGFRDKALEEKAAAKGYSLVSAFSGKVGLLLVPDGELKESEKVKSAKAKGIKILRRSEFTQQYLS